MQEQKEFVCTTGPKYNLVEARVNLNGVTPGEKMTPALARRACRVAFGHCRGVTVRSNDAHYYRIHGERAGQQHRYTDS